jgi:hypothetical protein
MEEGEDGERYEKKGKGINRSGTYMYMYNSPLSIQLLDANDSKQGRQASGKGDLINCGSRERNWK